ncbi:MAG: hypothetical protein HY721_21120 [Planctomycetes bacterium]|nr:hypothetical protein [Planctomycetota bacterium]
MARLFAWMDSDRSGLFFGVERTAVQALDRRGRAAFAGAARSRFQRELEAFRARGTKDLLGPDSSGLRRAAGVLKTISRAGRDREGYLSVVEAMELAPEDCEALAEVSRALRRPQEALSWVERGLKLSGDGLTSHDLTTLRMDLLKRLGRGDEAVACAWEAYVKGPSPYAFGELLRRAPEGSGRGGGRRRSRRRIASGSRTRSGSTSRRRRQSLRSRHHRKQGFLEAFEREVHGEGRPPPTPRFLERARRKWLPGAAGGTPAARRG